MANGWAHDGVVLEQIADTLTDGLSTTRARTPSGAPICVDCGDEIPLSRHQAPPAAPTCVVRPSERDGRIVLVGADHSGHKDSRLRSRASS